jgi:prolyl oligopeptidase
MSGYGYARNDHPKNSWSHCSKSQAKVLKLDQLVKGKIMEQPKARVEVVSETLYGVTIDDPYRWMENWQSEELQNWVKAQDAYSRAYFKKLPQRETLLKRITELSAAGAVISGLKIAGGRYFYLRRDPQDILSKLVMREGISGAEKILLDPNAIKGEHHTALDWYAPSGDGHYVAYGVSPGGSENSILHILVVDSGETLPETITRARFNSIGLFWRDDNQSFFYHRLAETNEATPPTERYLDSQTYLHKLGTDPAQDSAVFGAGVSRNVTIGRADFPLVVTHATSDWVIGWVRHGVLNELTLYATPSVAALNDPINCHWTKIVDVEDGVVGYAVAGDTIYLRSHQDAPRYKVIATSLSNPDLSNARLIVPPGQSVIEEIKVAGEYLLVRDLDAGIGRLRRVKLSGSEVEKVTLPFEGTISEWSNEGGVGEVFLQMTSWTVAPRILVYNVANNSFEDTNWLPPSLVDFSEIEAHEVLAPSKDGTLVPLSIVHKKGLPLDGNNPTLMVGYGSYGLIPYAPRFDPAMLAWYELGGVFAAAHIRGGGEYGKEWHEAGRKLTKQNTIDDFIACGEYLIKQGYTQPARLAGEGVSGGGIPSGGALVQRPELWSVMVMRVAVTNFLRFEFTENGPPNIPEFGSIATEEGFMGLQIMDSYTKVRDGVNYPAAFITTGMNDPRVVVWQATKMAARLQAASASGKPVLLRADYDGGHGMGSTRQQVDEELADKLAFLLQQFGVA